MYKNTYIRKFLAASLLLIFALSITPTKVLHYFFADHNDSVLIKKSDSNYPSLSVAGFNCQVDNLVVESPFTKLLQPVSCAAPGVISINQIHTAASFICADHFYFELRGPPSFA